MRNYVVIVVFKSLFITTSGGGKLETCTKLDINYSSTFGTFCDDLADFLRNYVSMSCSQTHGTHLPQLHPRCVILRSLEIISNDNPYFMQSPINLSRKH